MKKITILLLSNLFFLFTHAANDSLAVSRLDSTSILVDNCVYDSAELKLISDSSIFEAIESVSESKIVIKQKNNLKQNTFLKQQKNQSNKEQSKRMWPIFQWVVDVVNWVTSPFRPVWGGYEEGSNTHAGLTTFDRSKPVMDQVQDIRNKIIGNDYISKQIYGQIYSLAQNSFAACSGDDSVVCINAATAKCAAFVALISLNTDGTTMTYTTRTDMVAHAVDLLQHCDVWDLYDRFKKENQQYRSKELTQYIQALDYLQIMREYDGANIYISPADLDNCKSQLVSFTSRLHGRASNWISSYDSYNNMSIMAASAVGIAAIVLHDQTTWFWNNHAKPSIWAGAANFYISRTLWSGSKPMSKRVGLYGYAEGPGYFKYGFENAIPYFKTHDNYFNGNDHTGDYNSSALFYATETVRNYIYDRDYDYLYQWFNNLRQPNNYPVSYDDTRVRTEFLGLGIIKQKSGYNYNVFNKDNVPLVDLKGQTSMSLHADFLAASIADTNFWVNYKKSSTQMPSGEVVVYTNADAPMKDQHFLHVLAETGTALNGYIPFDWGHEHGDATSFTICAGEDELIIDPAYYGWSNRDNVNDGAMHNVVVVDGFAADPNESSTIDEAHLDNKYPIKDIKVSTQYNYGTGSANLSRKIEVITDPNGLTGMVYYVISDAVQGVSTAGSQYQEFGLNGNGNTTDGTFELLSSDNTARWSHPCIKNGGNNTDNWAVQATVINPGGYPLVSNDNNVHGDDNYKIGVTGLNTGDVLTNYQITKNVASSGEAYGNHSRISKVISVATGITNKFQTIIIPYKCGTTPAIPHWYEGSTYAHHVIHIGLSVGDSITNFHLTKNDSSTSTTISNPFEISGCTSSLVSQANNTFMSYASDSAITSGYCTSYTHFRQAKISEGKLLNYDGSDYINSNKMVNSLYYAIVGKYKYNGYITAPSGGDTVTFCIPDLDSGVAMVAMKGMTSALPVIYSDTADWKHIKVVFGAGTTDFSIQPANPCPFDCYFPPTATHIDSTFNANDGDLHTLGHKLNIIQSKGFLHVSNGTRINMCSGVYLRNLDSLLLDGPPQASAKRFNPCSGAEAAYNGDGSTMIIVSSGSALVLDSGSYTYLRPGGAIWVQQNGSLVINNNSFVQLGGDGGGYGEIILDSGSFLYVDPTAHIEFYKVIGDTDDKNIFNSRATAGVYSPFMETILDNDGILQAGVTPTPICNLNTVDPIQNREWGYCNFMNPYATYQATRDTLCPGDPVYIRLNRILNSSHTEVNVCRWDTLAIPDSPATYPITYHYRIIDTSARGFHYKDTCLMDTTWKDSVPPPSDLPCNLIHITPDIVVYHFKPNTYHRITVTTWNDCAVNNDTVGYIFIADSPRFSITIPDTVCPGSLLTVYVTDINHEAGYYTFGIMELPDSITMLNIMANPSYSSGLDSMTVSNFGYLPDSFTFSNFKLKGNRRYVAYLNLTNACGSYSSHGSVVTNFGAKIKIHLASTYNNPVGPSAFQLQGIALGETSFSWSPTTYLDNPSSLTPICTPSAPIQYVFTASNGTCTDRDTVHVRHNEWAYAGLDTEVCYNQNVILGTDYNAVAWLGLVWHSADHGNYDNFYNTAQTNIPNFGKYFMHFMLLHLTDYGSSSIVNFMNNEDLRSGIFKDADFITYYNNFISNNGNSSTFSDFETLLNNNSTLKSLVEGTYGYNPVSNFFDFNIANSMFNDYANWLNTTTDTFSVEWDRLDDTTWTKLSSATNYFNYVTDNTRDKYYRVTVVDNSTSTVEYDQVLVKRDSVVTPKFYISYQMDSTVFFADSSLPNLHDYRYAWNFGDGSLSTIKNPYHTFSGRDTSYIVCMTVRDSCGTYTKCDTLKIDTSQNTGLFGKRSLTDQVKQNNPQQVSSSFKTSDNYLSVNRPNPFSNYTVADYALADGKHDAEIKITDMLGQIVKTYKISQNKGMIVIDGSHLRDGMYYYYLIVDGTVVGSQVMVVQK